MISLVGSPRIFNLPFSDFQVIINNEATILGIYNQKILKLFENKYLTEILSFTSDQYNFHKIIFSFDSQILFFFASFKDSHQQIILLYSIINQKTEIFSDAKSYSYTIQYLDIVMIDQYKLPSYTNNFIWTISSESLWFFLDQDLYIYSWEEDTKTKHLSIHQNYINNQVTKASFDIYLNLFFFLLIDHSFTISHLESNLNLSILHTISQVLNYSIGPIQSHILLIITIDNQIILYSYGIKQYHIIWNHNLSHFFDFNSFDDNHDNDKNHKILNKEKLSQIDIDVDLSGRFFLISIPLYEYTIISYLGIKQYSIQSSLSNIDIDMALFFGYQSHLLIFDHSHFYCFPIIFSTNNLPYDHSSQPFVSSIDSIYPINIHHIHQDNFFQHISSIKYPYQYLLLHSPIHLIKLNENGDIFIAGFHGYYVFLHPFSQWKSISNNYLFNSIHVVDMVWYDEIIMVLTGYCQSNKLHVNVHSPSCTNKHQNQIFAFKKNNLDFIYFTHNLSDPYHFILNYNNLFLLVSNDKCSIFQLTYTTFSFSFLYHFYIHYFPLISPLSIAIGFHTLLYFNYQYTLYIHTYDHLGFNDKPKILSAPREEKIIDFKIFSSIISLLLITPTFFVFYDNQFNPLLSIPLFSFFYINNGVFFLLSSHFSSFFSCPYISISFSLYSFYQDILNYYFHQKNIKKCSFLIKKLPKSFYDIIHFQSFFFDKFSSSNSLTNNIEYTQSIQLLNCLPITSQLKILIHCLRLSDTPQRNLLLHYYQSNLNEIFNQCLDLSLYSQSILLLPVLSHYTPVFSAIKTIIAKLSEDKFHSHHILQYLSSFLKNLSLSDVEKEEINILLKSHL